MWTLGEEKEQWGKKKRKDWRRGLGAGGGGERDGRKEEIEREREEMSGSSAVFIRGNKGISGSDPRPGFTLSLSQTLSLFFLLSPSWFPHVCSLLIISDSISSASLHLLFFLFLFTCSSPPPPPCPLLLSNYSLNSFQNWEHVYVNRTKAEALFVRLSISPYPSSLTLFWKLNFAASLAGKKSATGSFC